MPGKGGDVSVAIYSQRRAGSLAKIQTLRTQAQVGGLRFIAHFPPPLASWLFDQIEDGLFANPKEAVFALAALYREQEPFDATREALLERACLAMCIEDHRRSLPPVQDIGKHVQNLLDAPSVPPAIWRE